MMYAEILSRREMIETILFIGDNPGLGKSGIMFRDGRDQNSRTIFLRIKDLIDYGLAEQRITEDDTGKITGLHIYLTPKGYEVHKALQELETVFMDVKRPVYDEI